MIDLRDVSKMYGHRAALYPVNLKLQKGKTHVLLGSSGSGKSTLLRLMSGLIQPSSGAVWIDGAQVEPSQGKTLHTKIGYVIQEGGLFPHLTAFANTALQAKTLGWSKVRIHERIAELARLVQLDPGLLKQYPKEMSGGQRQRVALMRALMLDPDLILLDEPLGALDPIVRADLQYELKNIFNQVKKTVALVTHDINEAAFFGHTLSLFHEGRLVQHGSFHDLAKKPASDFVTRFIRAQIPPPEVLELTQ